MKGLITPVDFEKKRKKKHVQQALMNDSLTGTKFVSKV